MILEIDMVFPSILQSIDTIIYPFNSSSVGIRGTEWEGEEGEIYRRGADSKSFEGR